MPFVDIEDIGEDVTSEEAELSSSQLDIPVWSLGLVRQPTWLKLGVAET